MASAGRKQISGTAVSVMLAAIAIFLGGTIHPYWSRVLYCAGGLSLLYVVLQFVWVQRLLGFHIPDAGEISPATSAQVGRDNSGVQISANNSPIIGADAIRAMMPKPTPQITPKPPSYPKLHWNFRYARVKGNNNVWIETAAGISYQALVVDISVDIPERGVKVRNCTLFGSIKIQGSDPRNTGFLNRLCWMGQAANEMSFEVGKSATLFAMCFEHDQSRPGPEWKSFSSKLNSIPDHPLYRQDFDPYRDLGRMTIPVDGQPTITISLSDARSAHVVDAKTVRINPLDLDTWIIEEVSGEA